MNYISTRSNIDKVASIFAINKGMVPTGGLFVPEFIPIMPSKFLNNLHNMTYQEIALEVLSLYFTDFTKEELKYCIDKAYSKTNFSHDLIAPITKLDSQIYVSELWHGPTAAFKDMALQIMPIIFSLARKKLNITEDSLILVATSGDTGKAALEGFKNVENTKVSVFYPDSGVSDVQKLQMETTKGKNLIVSSVLGNFDDCQSTVKAIFEDKEFNAQLKNTQLSSANSINLARLIPQVIYYFFSYAQLSKDLKKGEKVNFSVPTGNFGNILAGYYAKKMGLPIDKLICCSNKNNILHDFIKTGNYDTKRDFHKTMSPSMDILISSNLERFIYHQLDDKSKLNNFYKSLKEQKEFSIDNKLLTKIKKDILSTWVDEDSCLKNIKDIHDKYNYFIDPHTAIAIGGIEKSKDTKVVVMSTANIYKFPQTVVKAIYNKNLEDFQAIEYLEKNSNVEIHKAVKGLKQLKVNHNHKINPNEIRGFIKEFL